MLQSTFETRPNFSKVRLPGIFQTAIESSKTDAIGEIKIVASVVDNGVVASVESVLRRARSKPKFAKGVTDLI